MTVNADLVECARNEILNMITRLAKISGNTTIIRNTVDSMTVQCATPNEISREINDSINKIYKDIDLALRSATTAIADLKRL